MWLQAKAEARTKGGSRQEQPGDDAVEGAPQPDGATS
jgi:hypothetical protein